MSIIDIQRKAMTAPKPKNQLKKTGPPKLYETTLLIRTTKGTIADLDAVMGEGESRSDVIRLALEREIERRVRGYAVR